MIANALLYGNSSLMSPMTQSYVEAMIREGDSFDYDKWYQRARQEEAAKANRVAAASPAGDTHVVDLRQTKPDTPTTPESTRKAGFIQHKRVVRRSRQDPHPDASSSSLKQQLVEVCDSFDEFQESRDRDAVYGYLKAVFRIVIKAKGRRQTELLVRRAFKFAGLPYQECADPFATVIRCTCEHALNDKTISKWARALRYVAYRKRPPKLLKVFMKAVGGVNACAARYTKALGRGRP